jgi:hypothetical protein
MIPVVVTTVPSRAETFERLRSELGQFNWTQVVAYDRVDADRKGVVGGALRAARDLDPDAEWLIFMEDDAWLSREFDRIPWIIGSAGWLYPGAGLVSFFQTQDAPDGLREFGGTWLLYSVCVALRMPDPDAFDAFAREWYAEHPEHQYASDFLLGHWTLAQGHRILIHTPSLVQHDIDPTTFATRRSITTERRSASFERAGYETLTVPV